MRTTLVPNEAVAIFMIGWFNSGSIAIGNFDGFRIWTNIVPVCLEGNLDRNNVLSLKQKKH
jgi:hypothetical protein